MDFDLSADQVALRDAAAGLLDDRCGMDVVRRACDGGGFDADLWGAMVEQGWTGIAVPEALGGVGLGTVEAAVLLEQTGAHLAPVPLLQQLAALAALAEGPWGERLLSGEAVACVARTPLARAGDGSVSGRPEPVIYGARADVLVAPAGDELVAVDLAGVARSPEPAMDQTRELAWIELDAAPAATVGGSDEVAAHLDRGAVFHSAEMLGGAETVMNLAVEYAKVREQFGRPIGSFQAVKHRCADMLVDVEGMRSAVYHAAWTLGAAGPNAALGAATAGPNAALGAATAGPNAALGAATAGDPATLGAGGTADAAAAAATAKIWCSDAAVRVAESALQVHGGIGFTWEADVHLYLKRAQLDGVSFGDARHHRARLAAILRDRLATGASIWPDP